MCYDLDGGYPDLDQTGEGKGGRAGGGGKGMCLLPPAANELRESRDQERRCVRSLTVCLYLSL